MKAHPARPLREPAGLPMAALLWNIPPQSPAWGPLRRAGQRGLSLRVVTYADARTTVAGLCGLPALPAAPGPSRPAGPGLPPATPALVLCGLPAAERDALLDALRTAGADIPLKAVVTPINQSWRFGELLAELAREHAALHGAESEAGRAAP